MSGRENRPCAASPRGIPRLAAVEPVAHLGHRPLAAAAAHAHAVHDEALLRLVAQPPRLVRAQRAVHTRDRRLVAVLPAAHAEQKAHDIAGEGSVRQGGRRRLREGCHSYTNTRGDRGKRRPAESPARQRPTAPRHDRSVSLPIRHAMPGPSRPSRESPSGADQGVYITCNSFSLSPTAPAAAPTSASSARAAEGTYRRPWCRAPKAPRERETVSSDNQGEPKQLHLSF